MEILSKSSLTSLLRRRQHPVFEPATEAVILKEKEEVLKQALHASLPLRFAGSQEINTVIDDLVTKGKAFLTTYCGDGYPLNFLDPAGRREVFLNLKNAWNHCIDFEFDPDGHKVYVIITVPQALAS